MPEFTEPWDPFSHDNSHDQPALDTKVDVTETLLKQWQENARSSQNLQIYPFWSTCSDLRAM